MSDAHVVIAGAGPTGLMLACELALQGISRIIVVDPLPGPNRDPRANGVAGTGARLLDHRGLFEQLTGSTEGPQPLPWWNFGGFMLDISASPSPQHILMPVQQPVLTKALAERAIGLGVDVRWGHRLAGITTHPDGVDVEIDGPGGHYILHASYLVGADGGRGATRKLAGIEYVGMSSNDAVFRVGRFLSPPPDWRYEGTAELDIPGLGTSNMVPFLRSGTGMFFSFGTADMPLIGTLELAPTPDDTRAAHDHPGFGDPLTVSELRDSIKRVLGADVPLQPSHTEAEVDLRRYQGINSLIVDHYRKDRILLVGDAAHVQSPIGGPGLNLGLQDATNLGWKLAAVIRGDAAPALLDTYDTERRVAAEAAIRSARAQFAVLRPGLEITALREVLGQLVDQPAVARRLADLTFLGDVQYPTEPDDHPMVGRWTPDLTVTTATHGVTRIAQLAHDGRPLLLDFTAAGDIATTLGAACPAIKIVTGSPTEPIDLTALLVRPDGFIAWASSDPTPDLDRLQSVIARWFGATDQAQQKV